MFKDCDYFRTSGNDFYIAKGYTHPEGGVFSTHTFEPSFEGDRINKNGLTYQKVIEDRIKTIPSREIVEVFKPEGAEIKKQLEGEWQQIYMCFLEMGIEEENIGIFGSSLIGFPLKKDIDFIVYGMKNRNVLKENMTELKRKLGFTDITDDHIRYQTAKNSKFHNPSFTNFSETLKNKWSSIQIRPGILTTVRFGFRNNDLPSELEFFPQETEEGVIQNGVVVNDGYVDFTPRVFQIENFDKQAFWVKTLFWMYQSCVREGDKVCVRGTKTSPGVIGLIDQKAGVTILK